MIEIEYKLTAFVNDEIVFESTYPDTSYLQEDGLRKAEYNVEKAIKALREEVELHE